MGTFGCCSDIIRTGVARGDRTGTGTLGKFGISVSMAALQGQSYPKTVFADAVFAP
jgi:hypothetical protein